MNITQIYELEARYYASLSTATTSKDWHSLGNELAAAAKALRCVGRETVVERLNEKIDDCYETSRRLANGSDDIFPMPRDV